MLQIGIETIPVTIASGQSLSGAISLGAKTLVGIVMPAGWDAAGLSFQVSVDGSTFVEMQTTSAAVGFTAAASEYIAVDPAIWRGVNLLKVRSGTVGSAVNQSADRQLLLVVKPVA